MKRALASEKRNGATSLNGCSMKNMLGHALGPLKMVRRWFDEKLTNRAH